MLNTRQSLDVIKVANHALEIILCKPDPDGTRFISRTPEEVKTIMEVISVITDKGTKPQCIAEALSASLAGLNVKERIDNE